MRDPPGDVIFITSKMWQHILENLEISVDFYDRDKYNGVSVDAATNTHHQMSWHRVIQVE